MRRGSILTVLAWLLAVAVVSQRVLVSSRASSRARSSTGLDDRSTLRDAVASPSAPASQASKAYPFGRAYDDDRAGLKSRFVEVDPLESWPPRKGSILEYGPGCGIGGPGGGVEAVKENACAGRRGFRCPAVPLRSLIKASRRYSQILAAAERGCVRVFEPVAPPSSQTLR